MKDTGPILVPLDGSDLAEGALPWAAALARLLGAPLLLLSVWEGADKDLAKSFPTLREDVTAKAQEHFGAYLERARGTIDDGITVETRVREGEPGEAIPAAAAEAAARAIVIATHGRSGIGRWLYGSTASHLLRHAEVPVVAVGPRALERAPAEPRVRHIMVPLDGSEGAQQALPVAQRLATAAGARISLVRGVPWAATAYPYTLPDAYLPQVDEELEAGAKAYLREQEAAVKGDVAAFVVRGSVAEGLLEFEERESVDLVVMSTHARSGLARAALGSVADRMLQGIAPVLLIRPD